MTIHVIKNDNIRDSLIGQVLDLFSNDHEFESSQDLEAYMIINFRAYIISQSTRKLARTLTLIKKKDEIFSHQILLGFKLSLRDVFRFLIKKYLCLSHINLLTQ